MHPFNTPVTFVYFYWSHKCVILAIYEMLLDFISLHIYRLYPLLTLPLHCSHFSLFVFRIRRSFFSLFQIFCCSLAETLNFVTFSCFSIQYYIFCFSLLMINLILPTSSSRFLTFSRNSSFYHLLI